MNAVNEVAPCVVCFVHLVHCVHFFLQDSTMSEDRILFSHGGCRKLVVYDVTVRLL